MKIRSFVPSGSGVEVVHEILEKNIFDYKLKKYNPKLELFPFLISVLCKNDDADIVHTTPDYAYFIPKKKSRFIITFHNYVLDDFMQKYSNFYQKIHYLSSLIQYWRSHSDLYKYTVGWATDPLACTDLMDESCHRWDDCGSIRNGKSRERYHAPSSP